VCRVNWLLGKEVPVQVRLGLVRGNFREGIVRGENVQVEIFFLGGNDFVGELSGGELS